MIVTAIINFWSILRDETAFRSADAGTEKAFVRSRRLHFGFQETRSVVQAELLGRHAYTRATRLALDRRELAFARLTEWMH